MITCAVQYLHHNVKCTMCKNECAKMFRNSGKPLVVLSYLAFHRYNLWTYHGLLIVLFAEANFTLTNWC